MDFISKCKAAGIGDGSAYEGYPLINGRWIRKVDGQLKAYFFENLNPWEHPREDTAFDQEILGKISAIENDQLDQLHPDEQTAIEDAIAAEEEATSVPTISELTKRVEALEAAIAK